MMIRAFAFALLFLVCYMLTLETAGWFYVSKVVYFMPRAGMFVAALLFVGNFASKPSPAPEAKEKKQKAVPSAAVETPPPAVVEAKRERIAPELDTFVPRPSRVSSFDTVDEGDVRASYEALLALSSDESSLAEAAAQATEQPLAGPELVAAFEAFQASIAESAPASTPKAEKPKEKKFGRTVLVGAKGKFALSFDRRSQQNYLSPVGDDGAAGRDRIYLSVDSKDRKAVMAAAAAVIN